MDNCSPRGNKGKGRGKDVVSLWRGANCVVVAGAGLPLRRVRFCWQAQHLVPPGVGVAESVCGAVTGRCGAVPSWSHFVVLCASAAAGCPLIVAL